MSRETYISPQSFLIFRETGIVPTVPSPPTLRKSHADFLDTDLELGDWARNIIDGKIFYRNNAGIQTFDDYLFGPGTGVFHNHDDRYYTETEMDILLGEKVDSDNLPVASPSVLGCIKVGSNLLMSGEVLNATGGGAGSDWGLIGGDLVDQTDLQAALDAKADDNANTTGSAGSLLTTNFSITEISGELVIKYGSTIIGKITSAGYLKMKDEIEPFSDI